MDQHTGAYSRSHRWTAGLFPQRCERGRPEAFTPRHRLRKAWSAILAQWRARMVSEHTAIPSSVMGQTPGTTAAPRRFIGRAPRTHASPVQRLKLLALAGVVAIASAWAIVHLTGDSRQSISFGAFEGY